MSDWKVDVVAANTPDPVDLNEWVSFDLGDPAHPVMIDCDGWISLSDAEAIHVALSQAIESVKLHKAKELSRGTPESESK